MMRRILSLVRILALTCFSFVSYSQGIDGYFTVFVNGSNNGTYTYYAPDPQTGTWVFNRSSPVIDYIVAESSVYITIKFKAAGSLPISYWGSQTYSATINILASIPQPPAPSVYSTSCGQTIIQYSGTPPTNIEWHWQTTPGGQNTELGSTKNVTTSGSYYLQPYATTTSEWGPTSSALNVTVNPIPGTPSTNTIYSCGGVITLTTTVGTNGNSLKWYTTQTGGSALGSASQNVSSNTTFWASSFTSAGCESPGRAAVNVIVNSPPAPATLNVGTIHACAGQQIHITASGSGIPHYQIKLDNQTLEEWSNLGTDFYYASPAAGTLTIVTKSLDNVNGCGFGSVSNPVSVDVLAAPTQPDLINFSPSPLCPNSQATLSATPGNGDRVYWYSSASGGSPLTSVPGNNNSVVVGPLSSTTQFWVSSVRSGVCEGSRYPLSVVVTPNPPDDQTITSSSSTTCVGQAVQLTAAGPGNGNPYFYYSTNNGASWTLVPNSTGQSTLPFTPAAAGNYKFLVRNKTNCGFCSETGGCAEMNTTDVTVEGPVSNPGSLSVNNGNTNSCLGFDIPIVTTGANGIPVYWIEANGSSLVESGEYGSSFTYPANVSGNWKVTMKTRNACGLSEQAQSFQFTVWPKPGTPILPTAPGVCIGDNVNLTATPGENGTNVKWYTEGLTLLNPYPFTQPVNTGALTTDTKFFATSYANLCESDPVEFIVRAHPRPDAILDPAGIKVICGTCTQVLTTQHVPGQHYVWFKNEVNLNAPDLPTYQALTPGLYKVQVSIESCTGNGPVTEIRQNLPPTVNAGPDRQTFSNTDALDFIGFGYDTDGSIASYLWTKISGGNILMQNANTSKLTVSSIGPGPYTFRLTVTDDLGATAFDEVILSITDVAESRAYIIEEVLQHDGKVNDTDVNNALPAEKLKTTTYFDAIGRPTQTVQWQTSPSSKDIVQPVTYDAYGRTATAYLPYTSGNDGKFKVDFKSIESLSYTAPSFSPQHDFYQNTTGVATDPEPYAKTEFEPSPLNRVVKQGAPGHDWQPENNHAATRAYRHNTNKEVMKLTYVGAAEGVSLGTGCEAYYTSNTLTANSTKDEEGHEVIEFTDKFGRIVCKQVQTSSGYASTYYVFDNVGNLVVVIPPMGSEVLRATALQQCP